MQSYKPSTSFVFELKVYGNGKIYDIHLKVFFIDFQIWFWQKTD